MKQTIKKVLANVLALSMVISVGTIPSLAAGVEDASLTSELYGCVRGRDVHLNTFVIEDGAYIFAGVKETKHGTVVTEAGDPGERKIGNSSVCAYPEREETKSFTYNIYDRDGIFLAQLVSTINGVYSQADSYALISSVTGRFSGTFENSFIYTSSCSGNTGTIDICYNGAHLVSLSYRIYNNGSVQEI